MATIDREAALQTAWGKFQAARSQRERDRAYDQAEQELGPALRVAAGKFNARWEQADLMQAARLGLLRALESYREDQGATIATFSRLCIDRSILDFLQTEPTLIKGQARHHAATAIAEKRRGKLRVDLGREPTDAEIIQTTGNSGCQRALRRALADQMPQVVSAACAGGSGDDQGEYDQAEGAGAADNVADWLEAAAGTETIERLISLLKSERRQAVCRAKFLHGMDTCAEIGERLGITETQADNDLHGSIITWRRMAQRGELRWLEEECI